MNLSLNIILSRVGLKARHSTELAFQAIFSILRGFWKKMK